MVFNLFKGHVFVWKKLLFAVFKLKGDLLYKHINKSNDSINLLREQFMNYIINTFKDFS